METNKYGYKLCYKNEGSKKLHIYVITNTFSLAEFEMKMCIKYPEQIKQSNKTIRGPTWLIIPIKNKREYKKLWKDCPF